MYRLICCALLIASPAFAATTTPSAITMMDPIGTGCVDGGGYDDPFPSGKGVRAPAFCLPNPCDRALSRAELSRDIIGRDVENWEWDAYYSRYAEICRAEALGADAPRKPVTTDTFWEPLINPPQLAYLPAGRANSLFTNPNAGSGTSFSPGPGSVLTGGGAGATSSTPGNAGSGNTPDTTTPGGSDGGGGNTSNSGGTGTTPGGGGGTSNNGGGGGQPPVIPIPTPAWLLISAIIAIVTLRKRKIE